VGGVRRQGLLVRDDEGVARTNVSDQKIQTTSFRRREPPGPREARPDDRLREAIQSRKLGTTGLLRRLRASP
jgi:hypothetical protein